MSWFHSLWKDVQSAFDIYWELGGVFWALSPTGLRKRESEEEVRKRKWETGREKQGENAEDVSLLPVSNTLLTLREREKAWAVVYRYILPQALLSLHFNWLLQHVCEWMGDISVYECVQLNKRKALWRITWGKSSRRLSIPNSHKHAPSLA